MDFVLFDLFLSTVVYTLLKELTSINDMSIKIDYLDMFAGNVEAFDTSLF